MPTNDKNEPTEFSFVEKIVEEKDEKDVKNNYEKIKNAPPIPPAVRKLICRSQSIISERKCLIPIMKLIDHRNARALLQIIFSFLWKSGSPVSGIDIFKIACMNKLMNTVISQLYAPMKFTEFGRSHYFASFLQMINKAPDFECY